MSLCYDATAPKKAVNLSLNADLLRLGKELGLNVSGLATRVVVPLYRREAAATPYLARLTPLLDFQGVAYVAMVPELAGVALKDLGPSVGELSQQRAKLTEALVLLFTGI